MVSEVGHLTVVAVIMSALLALSVLGFFIVSPVLGIFVVVFALGSALVLREMRDLR